MRMRLRGHLEARLSDCAPIMLAEGEAVQWLPSPLCIEIGCGKGEFITALAALNPETNYIAVEKVSNVIVLAAERAMAAELNNLKFLRADFTYAAKYFPDGCAEKIYLNFSDPWPKNGHAKRRLTHEGFLRTYKRILVPGGEIHFKTDNRALFEFSVKTLEKNGFGLKNITYDLHADNFEGNIMTEYEKYFCETGTPICRLEAYKTD